MKKKLIFILLSSIFSAYAQFITLPDTNFRNALIAKYPSCFNVNLDLDTTCTDIVNATYLDVQGVSPYITLISDMDGIQYFDNLDTLYCGHNKFTTIVNLPSNLKYLNCFGVTHYLSSLPNLPNTLKYLDISYQVFTTLPNLPNTLEYLYCKTNMNMLISITSLPTSLKILDCEGNQLTNLPTLPNSLTTLNCNNNQLTSLPALPSSLTMLYCNSNQLTSLPSLPNSLTTLNCNNNQLTNLPVLPNALIYLDCKSNQLISVPPLPSTLTSLDCSFNKLTFLPSLPNIPILYCNYNKLTSLPLLPNSITQIYCDHNELNSLPSLPLSLTQLNCNYNQLTSLPSLPNTLTSLLCGNNKLLYCLPLLPNSLTYLDFTGSRIWCIPNQPTNLATFIPCSGSVCEPNPTASGLVFHDINSNGIYEIGIDSTLKGWIVTNTNGWAASTSQNGEFISKLDNGVLNTLTLSISNNYIQSVTPNNYQITPSSLASQGSNYNFAVQFIPNVQDLKTDIAAGVARPGFNQWVTTIVNNLGTNNFSNATVKVVKPTTFTLSYSNPVISQQIGDTLIWNNVNINILQQKSFDLIWGIPTNAVLGANYEIEAWTEPTLLDTTPINNYSIWNDVFKGSYDPNDKQVNNEQIDIWKLNDELVYTIRFQNTGTDTAITVLIVDTLSTNLDMSTFKIVGASHSYSYIVRDHTLLEVFFQNIYLPDSFVNEPKSHGFVQFSIKPKSSMVVNEEIDNTAYIYFDYNTPVVTNTVNTKIVTTNISNKTNPSLSIYPNPAKTSIFVQNKSNEIYKVEMMDVLGQNIKSFVINSDLSEFELTGLSSGLYFLKFTNQQNETFYHKFIKE